MNSPGACPCCNMIDSLQLVREEYGGNKDYICINCKLICSEENLRTLQNKIPMELALCESEKLLLKPDQPYIFRVHKGCVDCERINATIL